MTGSPYGERNVWGSIAATWSPLFGLAADADLDDIRAAVDARR